jgi:hypothetical protein
MFDDGMLVSEIVPELWMLGQYSSQVEGSTYTRQEGRLTVLGREE